MGPRQFFLHRFSVGALILLFICLFIISIFFYVARDMISGSLDENLPSDFLTDENLNTSAPNADDNLSPSEREALIRETTAI